MATLVTVFMVSLLGSLHCVGMCGPLVAVAVGARDVSTHVLRALLHVAYHGGRLLTYTLVGLVCGLVGASLDWGGSFLGVQRLAAALVGGMMVLVGLVGVLRYSGVRVPTWTVSSRVQQWIVSGQRWALRMPPLRRAAVIGLLTAFLPCGWLYMFAIVAAGTGSVVGGGAVMIAFWLGSVPVLALLGISVQTFAATLGKRIPLAISAIIILLGLYTLGGRLTIDAAAFEPARQQAAPADTLHQVEEIGRTEPPCCCHQAE